MAICPHVNPTTEEINSYNPVFCRDNDKDRNLRVYYMYMYMQIEIHLLHRVLGLSNRKECNYRPFNHMLTQILRGKRDI